MSINNYSSTRPELNGMIDTQEPQKIYNQIGERYFAGSESDRKRFIEVAQEKAIQFGSTSRDIAKMFHETHSKTTISKVYSYYLHAAHLVYGMEFDLTVRSRSKDAKTFYSDFKGNPVAITIESIQ